MNEGQQPKIQPTALMGGRNKPLAQAPDHSLIVTLADPTGVADVPNGGTGLTSGTSGGIPFFSSTTTMGSSALLATNQLILGGGAGNAPASLGSLGTTAQVLHGNASGAPTWGAVALASDVSGDLPFANLAQGSALSVLGVTGNATADLASIAAGTDNQVLRRSGTAVAFGAVNLASGNAVTGTLPTANLDAASGSDTRTATSTSKVLTPSSLQDYLTPQTLTDAATIAWNMASGVNASVTLGDNRTLGAPTNIRAGSSGMLTITQDGTGSRTLAFNSAWKFAGGTDPALSTAAGAIDLLAWYSPDGTNLFAVLNRNFS